MLFDSEETNNKEVPINHTKSGKRKQTKRKKLKASNVEFMTTNAIDTEIKEFKRKDERLLRKLKVKEHGELESEKIVLANDKCNEITQNLLAKHCNYHCYLSKECKVTDSAFRQLEMMHCDLREQFKEKN